VLQVLYLKHCPPVAGAVAQLGLTRLV